MPASYPTARTRDFLAEEIADELILYDLAGKRAHCLNRTAAVLWQLADGSRSVDELARMLAVRLALPPSDVLVRYGLQQLTSRGLLEDSGPSEGTQPLATRREVMRLGLAAAIIPSVLSMALPRPSFAQSGGPTGATGETGATGATGETGPTGATGPTGP
jgi:hypothetical protein